VCTSAGLFTSFGGLHLVGHGRLWSPLALFAAALLLIVIGWRFLLMSSTSTSSEPHRARDDPIGEGGSPPPVRR
jgi:hypothetical protein